MLVIQINDIFSIESIPTFIILCFMFEKNSYAVKRNVKCIPPCIVLKIVQKNKWIGY